MVWQRVDMMVNPRPTSRARWDDLIDHIHAYLPPHACIVTRDPCSNGSRSRVYSVSVGLTSTFRHAGSAFGRARQPMIVKAGPRVDDNRRKSDKHVYMDSNFPDRRKESLPSRFVLPHHRQLPNLDLFCHGTQS